MEPLGQSLIQRCISQLLQLRHIGGIVGNFGILRARPVGRNGHHACRGNLFPFREGSLGRIVEFAGSFEVIGFLKTTQGILRAHAHFPVDHARTKANPIENHLSLHDGAFFFCNGNRVAISIEAVEMRIVVRRHRVGQIVSAIGVVT